MQTAHTPASDYECQVLRYQEDTTAKANRPRLTPAPRSLRYVTAEEQRCAGLEMAYYYLLGNTGPEIAARYGVTPARVTQLVGAATGKTPSQVRADAGWIGQVSPRVVEAVLEAYRADPHAPTTVLAERAGTTAHSVASVLAAQDPPVDRTHVRRTPVAALPVDADELGRLYVEEGLSTVDLAAWFGVDPSTVGERLKAAGVQMRPRGGGDRAATRKVLAVSDDELARLYVEDELSTVELGDRFACSPTLVRRRLKAAGVQMRPPTRRKSQRGSGAT